MIFDQITSNPKLETEISQSTPFRDPSSSLAHHPVAAVGLAYYNKTLTTFFTTEANNNKRRKFYLHPN